MPPPHLQSHQRSGRDNPRQYTNVILQIGDGLNQGIHVAAIHIDVQVGQMQNPKSWNGPGRRGK